MESNKVIEIKDGLLPIAEEALPNINEEIRIPSIKRYVEDMYTVSWKRHHKIPSEVIDTPKLLKNSGENCDGLGDNNTIGQAGFDRLCVVLPRTVKRIILFPSIGGDINLYKRCVKYITVPDIPAVGIKDDEDNVIIFSPNFYGNDVNMNVILFNNFLQLQKSKASIYILNHNTELTKKQGCEINRILGYDENSTLFTSLEPTYIVYPFHQIIDGINRSGILFTGATADEVDIPVSSIPSRVGSLSDYLNKELRGALAIPPNTKANDDTINKVYPYEVYRFFKSPGAGFIVDPTKAVDFILKEAPQPDLASVGVDDTFYPTPDDQLVLDTIQKKNININGQLFSVRVPSAPVKDNWRVLKFTGDEAELINSFNFRPSILAEVFKSDPVKLWKNELADFLENMINSECFIDRKLLTTSECDKSEVFINKVFEYFLVHDDRIATQDERNAEEVAGKTQQVVNAAVTATEVAKNDSKRATIQVESLKKQFHKHSKLVGVPTDIAPEQLQRNPFKEKVIKQIRGQLAIKREIYNIMDGLIVSSKWGREILVYNKEHNAYSNAEIVVDLTAPGAIATAGQEFAANQALKRAIDRLSTTYPGWVFMYPGQGQQISE